MNLIREPVSQFCNLMTYTKRTAQHNPEAGSEKRKGLNTKNTFIYSNFNKYLLSNY